MIFKIKRFSKIYRQKLSGLQFFKSGAKTFILAPIRFTDRNEKMLRRLYLRVSVRNQTQQSSDAHVEQGINNDRNHDRQNQSETA